MFAAAATCFKNTEQIDQDRRTSCQDEHEDTCNAAFVILNEIHAPNNDRHKEPNEKDVAAAVAHSQVPDVMIDVLRRSVCSRRTVDPTTRKTFWRIKRLEDQNATTAGQDVSLNKVDPDTGPGKSDHSTVSRLSEAQVDSDSGDRPVNAVVDPHPNPSTPTSSLSPSLIARATESEAYPDDNVASEVVEPDERDQPYVSVFVTGPTSSSNPGPTENHQLHSA